MMKKMTKFQKIGWAVMIGVMTSFSGVVHDNSASAAGCPDVKFVFARGSGSGYTDDGNYNSWKSEIEKRMSGSGVNYEFENLAYPAVAVGFDHLETTIQAYTGAGDSYEFGASVDEGVKMLVDEINNDGCANTKYALAGYSQGAMVVSKGVHSIDSEKVIYAATVGDPKIYLPEGKGLFPDACRGVNLSNYRIFVPDCRAYEGKLGSYRPYAPVGYDEKIGTWCNKHDFFCSPYLDVKSHVSYTTDNIYSDVARATYEKVAEEFGLDKKKANSHDTAILLDTTGSMSEMIEQYKDEALRLAKETLDSGGRVALYVYRDLDDPFEATEMCNFESCSLEVFEEKLNNLWVDGGGDDPESLLSSSLKVMKELNWKQGATKSLVVLTDANYLSPDRDGTTLEQVVELSKKIDPVNFYVVTNEWAAEYYQELAEKTDGKVVSDLGTLSLAGLTDYILERADSLPRVEMSTVSLNLPEVVDVKIEDDGGSSVKIRFETTGDGVIVGVNDVIMGRSEGNEIEVGELDRTRENVIHLSAYRDDMAGEATEVVIPVVENKALSEADDEAKTTNGLGEVGSGSGAYGFFVKAPNTGRK